ncbi:membrane protein insertase YidC [Patescibacteria group bacterium]|nr:membrane protein insertase YidC [Patescibacteria group bacterium]
MGTLWNLIIYNPILNILVSLYQLTSNLGISIIVFTVLVRVAMIPVMAPAMKMRKKQQELKPKLDKIKEKYKDDKMKLAEKQMDLMKQNGVNPSAGCLTSIIMIVVMIAVYRAVSSLTNGIALEEINNRIYLDTFKFTDNYSINKNFLYLDLSKPDPYYVVTGIAVIVQFLTGMMMLPYVEEEEKKAEKTPSEMDDMAASIQKQNIFMTPIMFLIFGMTLPSGVMIYIVVSTLAQLAQSYHYTGWGGLTPWIKRLKFGNVKS